MWPRQKIIVKETHTWFLFTNWPIYPEILQVRSVPGNKLLGIVVAELLQARCPSCHPADNVRALKDDGVSDLETAGCHHAVMVSQEHCCGSSFTGRLPILSHNQEPKIKDLMSEVYEGSQSSGYQQSVVERICVTSTG